MRHSRQIQAAVHQLLRVDSSDPKKLLFRIRCYSAWTRLSKPGMDASFDPELVTCDECKNRIEVDKQ